MSQGCLRIEFEPTQKELVIAALLAHDIQSFQEGEFGDTESEEAAYSSSASGQIPREDSLIVCYFATPEEAARAEAQLAAALDGVRLSVTSIAEEAWQETWKQYSTATEISPTLLVRASFHQVTAAPGQLEILIDSEQAFGTGAHPTTKMCLRYLESAGKKLAAAPLSVLDVGCGSGVLSIAADLYGATCVVGIDIEEAAIQASAQNAAANNACCCQFSTTALAQVPGQFDLVLANILSGTLLELWPQLLSHCQPGGSLLVSGLLESELPQFIAEVAEEPVQQWVEDEWACLLFSRS